MHNTVSLDGAARLTDWGVIRAHGADAAKFLHGQLTNDVLSLGLGEARLAGFCSAKGRLLASFILWKAAPDDVFLACHQSVLPPTLKRLSMFVMRAQCKLTDASAEFSLIGLAGQSARNAVGDAPVWSRTQHGDLSVIRLPDAQVAESIFSADGAPGDTRKHCIALGAAPAGSEASAVSAASAAAPANHAALALDVWNWLSLHSGVPVIESSTAEQFVPQMINFELVGGVNFQKGCYPGQEVVARSQYRGTIKRRMFLADVDGVATPGQEVFQGSDPSQPAGRVVNAAPCPSSTSFSALVELKLAALPEGDVHLGSASGPLLALRPMPYEVPLDAPNGA